MNIDREQVIAWARKARLLRTGDGWTEPYRWGASELERFAALAYAAGAAAEREACLALHDHEDVLAPVGASAWGEAYQEGWAEGTAAYHAAIRARGQA